MQKRLEITTRGAQDAEGQFPRDRPNPAMKGFAPHQGLLQAGGFPALHCLTLHLLTAQPPLAMGPAEPDPPAGLRPRAVPDAWGCPGVPPAAQLMAGATGRAWLPGPALRDPHGDSPSPAGKYNAAPINLTHSQQTDRHTASPSARQDQILHHHVYPSHRAHRLHD